MKNQKTKEERTSAIRLTEQAHRKLSAYKALNGCKTLSVAIEKLLKDNK
jgi:hypothetical protein